MSHDAKLDSIELLYLVALDINSRIVALISEHSDNVEVDFKSSAALYYGGSITRSSTSSSSPAFLRTSLNTARSSSIRRILNNEKAAFILDVMCDGSLFFTFWYFTNRVEFAIMNRTVGPSKNDYSNWRFAINVSDARGLGPRQDLYFTNPNFLQEIMDSVRDVFKSE